MYSMRNLVLVLCTGVLLQCASTNEKQALAHWQSENLQWRSAGADPGPNATLDEYVQYALRHNPGLRAAFERWRAALEKVAPARTLEDPRFTYGYFIDAVETRVGAQRQRFGLAQTLPWFGELDLSGRLSLKAVAAAHQRYAVDKLALIHRVEVAYCEFYYLQCSIDITRENMELMTFLEEVARAKYKGGRGAHQTLIKTQVELGKLEDRLARLRDRVRPFAARLNAAISRPTDAALEAPTVLQDSGLELTDAELVTVLRQRNPALKALEHLAAREELAVELARQGVYPDVTLGVDYIVTDAADVPVPPPDSGKDPIVAMVSVNLPIWRDKYSAVQRQAQARQQEVLHQRQEKESQLVAELEMALYEFRDAERRRVLYRDSLLPKAEQGLKVSQQAFAAGESDFLDLIDAQRVLLEFQLAQERAHTDGALHLAAIDRLSARRLPAIWLDGKELQP